MTHEFLFEKKARKVMLSVLPHHINDLAMGIGHYSRFFGGNPSELLDAMLDLEGLNEKFSGDRKLVELYTHSEHMREDIRRISFIVSLPTDQVLKILKDRCALPFDQAELDSL